MTEANTVDAAYEAIRGEVGRVERLPLGRVRARDFQRYAAAAGDLNPVYLDAAAARAAGYDDVVAPAGYLTSVLEWGWGPDESELRPDGVTPATLAHASVEGLRLMGAGQELTFYQEVADGLELVMETCVHDVALKHGESGPFLILRISRRYLEPEGRPVVECLESFIGR